MKKLILFSVLVLIFFSCSENNREEDELLANDFRGVYKISSMTTELPFDLNNDDFQSTNYLEEISLPYKLHNGQIVNYGFTPNNPLFKTTAKPYLQYDNETKFLEMYLPENDMSPIYIGNNNFVNISLGVDRLYMTLVYKLVNGQVEIESDPFDFFAFNNMTNFSIMRLNKDIFEIKFRKNFYDFKDEVEKNTEIKVIFERI
jgi:hypothetical protein